ncbi:unnamed protein product [Rotaria sordida]|uniref:G-protein coupled receptors family 1 profile domain-containing protein n=1 Tax=Rotaria sordida TaxID=392033 RepID=A0A816DMV6_9BILA|nr:unnamed protein product [Rotaria sordida]CAF1638073.1 unnamed protein product [Rotaria sordida]
MNATLDDDIIIIYLSNIGLYLMRYVLMIIIILGLVGNFFNILVFHQPTFRSNPCSFYLITAAYVNIIWIMTSPLSRILATFQLDLSENISIICKIRRSLSYTFSSLSMISIAFGTVDRFIINSSQIEYRQLSSLHNAHRLMIITAFICWLIFVDMIYCLDVIVTPPSIACTINTRRICDLYNEIARLIVLVFIPSMLILIFGYGTIQHVKTSRRMSRLEGNTIHRIDRHLTQMVIGEIILIMISYIPNTIQRIYLVLTLDIEKNPLRLRIEILSGEVTFLMTTFQSSLSFYIYATMGGTLFRQTFKKLL